jgi:hypothetical protein
MRRLAERAVLEIPPGGDGPGNRFAGKAKVGWMGTSSIFVLVDDKHVPIYRIMWVSDVPHFCGSEDCQCEGDYEIRLEQDESVWASRAERDNVLRAMEAWYRGQQYEHGWEDEDDSE